jgi:hypothetical protein
MCIYMYVGAAVKINCLRLVRKYRSSFFLGGGGLSLCSVWFKSTLKTRKMQRNCCSSMSSASSKISFIKDF